MIRTPRVVLCTIALNEMEWLPRLYQQHRHWPGRKAWVFVEGADAEYARCNPDRVSEGGLSVDGTSEFLKSLAEQDWTVRYVPYGFGKTDDPAQGKCVLRQRYLDIAEEYRPDFLIVLDADEFYTKTMQHRIAATLESNAEATAFVFRHREMWKPPCRGPEDSAWEEEAVGGFWEIPYCRIWRWREGLRYEKNHNTPQDAAGNLLDRAMARYDSVPGMPYYNHMAFASSRSSREAKHRYYEERGEKADRKRRWYCESRRAWADWKPGQPLPWGGRVVRYDGLVPECFQ